MAIKLDKSFQRLGWWSKAKLKHNLSYYFANLTLIWLIILFYRQFGYYNSFLRSETQSLLLYSALLYTMLAFAIHLIMPAEKITKNKGVIVWDVACKLAKCFADCAKGLVLKQKWPFPKFEKIEKITLLFLLVKIFFTPLMINFFFNNYFSVKEQIGALGGVDTLFSVHGFNVFMYPFMLSLIFLADTLYFSFGYLFEAKFLKNSIRSVEPTILGWAVALVCYPPFNSLYGKYINWYANDMVSFGTDTATFIMRSAVILFLLGYLGATIALGTKCSNLTNRGIVTKGPYAIIRHPAYVCKNLSWWITIIPVMSWGAFLSMLSWSVIYFFRAITEERHLMKDPEYREYCAKVRHRFIPGII